MRTGKIVLKTILVSFCLYACHSNPDKKQDASLFQAKVDGAVSCTSIGLVPADSVLYMHGCGDGGHGMDTRWGV